MSVDEVDKHVLKKYDIVQKLGKGAYAVVFKAVDKKTKQTVALKKIFDAFQNATDAQRTFREIMYLQALSAPTPHANIIRLQNFLKAENDKDIYLVFDFMETDLHAVIRANILEPVHKQFIVYQSLKAIKYCHTGGLLHRDLKPSNLLLDEQCVLKVADFGLARTIKEADDAAAENTVLTDYVATRWYRAPEIILGSTSYSRAVDMWALGCIIAEMFLGKPLLPGNSTVDQLDKILVMTGVPNAETTAAMKSKFTDAMIAQLKGADKEGKLKDASDAHRTAQVTAMMQGKCDTQVIHMISAMLDIDPRTRMTVQQALAHPWMKPFIKENEEQLDLCTAEMTISLDDDNKFSSTIYRDKLYNELRGIRHSGAARFNRFFGRRDK